MPRIRDQELLRQVGARVAQTRTSHGWTQEQLAEAVGIEPVSLSRLETGHRALSLSTLGRMADALQVSLSDLLDPEREVPETEHSPQVAELVRVFGSLSRKRQNLLLRLAREMAS